MLQSCRAKAVLANAESMGLLRGVLGKNLGGVQLLSWNEALDAPIEEWTPGDASLSKVALLQYTSGSTANPRGVMVTHDNILFQVKGIGFWDVPTLQA
jgi:acyl-CoA synthetase (AMP-forming)/AMP-acid ligase II